MEVVFGHVFMMSENCVCFISCCVVEKGDDETPPQRTLLQHLKNRSVSKCVSDIRRQVYFLNEFRYCIKGFSFFFM